MLIDSQSFIYELNWDVRWRRYACGGLNRERFVLFGSQEWRTLIIGYARGFFAVSIEKGWNLIWLQNTFLH